jgi:hypothetical protein
MTMPKCPFCGLDELFGDERPKPSTVGIAVLALLKRGPGSILNMCQSHIDECMDFCEPLKAAPTREGSVQ